MRVRTRKRTRRWNGDPERKINNKKPYADFVVKRRGPRARTALLCIDDIRVTETDYAAATSHG